MKNETLPGAGVLNPENQRRLDFVISMCANSVAQGLMTDGMAHLVISQKRTKLLKEQEEEES